MGQILGKNVSKQGDSLNEDKWPEKWEHTFNSQEGGMDIFLGRFPHIPEMIFGQLPDQSLAKCREVSKSWCNYLDQQKFFHVRMIKGKVGKFHDLGESWKEVFQNSNTKTIIELSIAVDQFYFKIPDVTAKLNHYSGLTPLHVTAGAGNVQLYKVIQKKAKTK